MIRYHIILICFLCFCVTIFYGRAGADADGGGMSGQAVISIGAVEEVILLPREIRLPARIDTGAATTSLDARNIRIVDEIAEFNLPDKYGGTQFRLPVVDRRMVKSAGTRQVRPVVEIEICLGSKRLTVQANLNDRSQVKYPLIIGRNVLKNGFVVDCAKTERTKPSCAGISGR